MNSSASGFDNIAEATGLQFNDITGTEIHPKEISPETIVYDIWKFEKKKKAWCFTGIYRNGFLDLCSNLGYSKRYHDNGQNFDVIKDNNGVIETTTTSHLIDDVFYPNNGIVAIKDIEFKAKGLNFSFNKELLAETYLNQYNNVVNDNFLKHLETHTKPILKDTAKNTYLYFSNSIVDISKDNVQTLSYDYLEERDVCIWKDYIQGRDFKYINDGKKCEFEKFIENVAGNEQDRIDSFKSSIGYLINTNKSQANSRAVILYDEEPTDLRNPEGGTGKGLFSNMLKYFRSVACIDGKKFIPDDKFRWQLVNHSTQIVWLDDLSTKVSFETLHSALTEGLEVEKKHKGTFTIPFENSPNWVLTSNTFIKGDGNTNERRQHILEFSPYYKSLQTQGIGQPIIAKHGCMFFDEWSLEEWNRFDSFIAECCQFYHKNGLVSYKRKNVNKNKLIQDTSFEFYEWLQEADLKPDVLYNPKELFEDYRVSAGLDENTRQNSFTRALKRYCAIEGYEYKTKKSNGNTSIYLKVKK